MLMVQTWNCDISVKHVGSFVCPASQDNGRVPHMLRVAAASLLRGQRLAPSYMFRPEEKEDLSYILAILIPPKLNSNGCGSKKWYQNGTLVNGTKDQNPHNPSSLNFEPYANRRLKGHGLLRLALVVALVPLSAEAARSGGRMGGRSSAPRSAFRAAPRPRAVPRRDARLRVVCRGQKPQKSPFGLKHGYGSKLNHQGTTGFGPCFYLAGFHFGYICLTHSHIVKKEV